MPVTLQIEVPRPIHPEEERLRKAWLDYASEGELPDYDFPLWHADPRVYLPDLDMTLDTEREAWVAACLAAEQGTWEPGAPTLPVDGGADGLTEYRLEWGIGFVWASQHLPANEGEREAPAASDPE